MIMWRLAHNPEFCNRQLHLWNHWQNCAAPCATQVLSACFTLWESKPPVLRRWCEVLHSSFFNLPCANRISVNYLPIISPKPPLRLRDWTLTVVMGIPESIIAYNRQFPFAYAWPDSSAATVIQCLTDVFVFRRALLYPFQQGSSFVSAELKKPWQRHCL